jgi:hypothetical protein
MRQGVARARRAEGLDLEARRGLQTSSLARVDEHEHERFRRAVSVDDGAAGLALPLVAQVRGQGLAG